MADTKISALPASTTPLAGTEVLPIVQSSVTKQVSVANLTAGRAVSTGALTVASADATIYGLTVGRGAGAVSGNTAVGTSALATNSTGDALTAIGFQAANASTAGKNTAVGYTAMKLTTTGAHNTAVGGGDAATYFGALYSNTIGSYNTAVGNRALTSNVSADNSTAVGYQAGGSSTGTGNQFFGYSSGSAVTTGAKNVIVGSYTGSAAPISATGSNHIVLSDGDGNVRGFFNDSGNLLVGTSTVIGVAKQTIGYNGNLNNGLAINETQNVSNTAFIYFYDGNGSAIIGSVTRVGTTAAVIYNTTSDYRLKTVVGAVTGAGERIDALKPIDYLWKEGSVPARGFLAHEFQEVYASSVKGTKDAVDANGKPVYQAMQAATSEVIADLVAELQSLRARVAQLESKP